MDIVIILLLIIIFILAVFSVVVFIYSFKTNRRFDELLEKGKIKDFKDVILKQKEKNDSIEERIKEIFLRVEDLEKHSKISIQKTAVVRFDPYGESSGKQSFAIAMLDKGNNGLVISSLFVNETNRVYSKEIRNGESKYALSTEEIEAINKALNKKSHVKKTNS